VSYGVDPGPRAASGGTLESSPGAGPSIDSMTASLGLANANSGDVRVALGAVAGRAVPADAAGAQPARVSLHTGAAARWSSSLVCRLGRSLEARTDHASDIEATLSRVHIDAATLPRRRRVRRGRCSNTAGGRYQRDSTARSQPEHASRAASREAWRQHGRRSLQREFALGLKPVRDIVAARLSLIDLVGVHRDLLVTWRRWATSPASRLRWRLLRARLRRRLLAGRPFCLVIRSQGHAPLARCNSLRPGHDMPSERRAVRAGGAGSVNGSMPNRTATTLPAHHRFTLPCRELPKIV